MTNKERIEKLKSDIKKAIQADNSDDMYSFQLKITHEDLLFLVDQVERLEKVRKNCEGLLNLGTYKSKKNFLSVFRDGQVTYCKEILSIINKGREDA